MAIDIGLFDLQSATLELRYATNFLFWDHSGSIWAEIAKKYPEFELETANPNEVKVKADNKTHGVIATDRAIMTVTNPKRHLDELKEFAATVCQSLLAKLDIPSFTRLVIFKTLSFLNGQKAITKSEASVRSAISGSRIRLMARH